MDSPIFTGAIMRVGTAIVLVLLVAFAIGRLSAGPQSSKTETRTKPSVGMKMKLDAAKEILAGLAQGDFKKLVEHGKAMQGLNAVEEFVRGKSPAYRSELNQFRYATRHLVRAAQKKNLEGATLAYTQMTMSCVNCHKLLR